MAKTQIQRQDACIARMLEPRSSERRAAKNRAAALASFREQCATAGYNAAQIAQMVTDIKDMVALEQGAE